MEKVRSILNGVGLTQQFLVVTIDTTCYLKNRSPTLVLGDKTHHEVWSSKKPSIAHLNDFRFDTFMHVSKDKRSKIIK